MLAKTAAVVGRTDYSKKPKKKKQSKFGFLLQQGPNAAVPALPASTDDDASTETDDDDRRPEEAAQNYASPLSLSDLDRSLSPVLDHDAAIASQLARLIQENDEKEAENARKRAEVAELLALLTLQEEDGDCLEDKYTSRSRQSGRRREV